MKKLLYPIRNTGAGYCFLYLILFTFVFAASDATEAAVMDFSDYNLTGYNIVSHHESNFTSSKEIIGTLKSTVYKKDSILPMFLR
jgi:hypothetical protein